MSMNDALGSAEALSDHGEPGADAEALARTDGQAGEPTSPADGAGGDETSHDGPSPEEVEAEARAKSTGWRGPSPTFPDAASWNEHAENNLPLIQSANRKLERELEQLRQADEAREARVEARIDRAVKAAQAAFDRQQSNDRQAREMQWDNAIRAAANRGEDVGQLLHDKRRDMAAWDQQAAKDRETHEKDATVDALAQHQTGPSEEDKEAFTAWVGENEWFETDEDLAAFASGLINRAPASFHSKPIAEQLAWVSKKVKESPLYAAKYGRSAPPRASAVGTQPARGPNGQFVPDNVGKLSTEDKRDFEYLWRSLNGAPYQGETDKDKALKKYADRLMAKA